MQVVRQHTESVRRLFVLSLSGHEMDQCWDPRTTAKLEEGDSSKTQLSGHGQSSALQVT